MRTTKAGRRYRQDLSAQHHPGRQRLPPTELLAGNAKVAWCLFSHAQSQCWPEDVASALAEVVAALEKLRTCL